MSKFAKNDIKSFPFFVSIPSTADAVKNTRGYVETAVAKKRRHRQLPLMRLRILATCKSHIYCIYMTSDSKSW